uniref:Tail fiber protein n=1 Tax=Escherichia phage RCF TaxID=3141436 RepID=A0AAU6SHC2_9CAUD
MATTIKTVMTYPLDGSTTDFNIPFEYLARKFVRVTLIGVDRKELILNQDYRFATKTTISTTRALGPADGYNLIEIRRYTSATERLVDFTDGSILRAYDLNISQVQTLHVAEEARDLTADTIGVNNDGDLDARGRRIVNVADAKDPGDAITLGQVSRWNESALNSKNAAAASQQAAAASQQAAKTSENNSKVSENNAKTSESNAHQWAQRAEDSPVQGSEFSAYHYSRKASKSAAAASTSEGNAKTSENNAKTSENNAKTSESNAATSAATAIAEAAKLTNMNDFATTIKAVNTATYSVSWKGDGMFDGSVTAGKGLTVSTGDVTINQGTGNWVFLNGYTAVGVNYTSNGIRTSNRNNQRVDDYTWEATGQYFAKVVHVYQAGNPNIPEFFYEFRNNGTVQLGQVRAIGGDESTFQHNVNIQWGGRGARYQENGDIVSIQGDASIFREFGGTLSGTINWLKNVNIQDVWLGGQEWWGSLRGNGNSRSDWALGGGSVCTGVTQDMTAGERNAWIDGIFHRKVWIRYGSGQQRIIASV